MTDYKDTILEVDKADLLAAGILTQAEIDWRLDLRIPYDDDTGMHVEMLLLDRKITKALEAGIVKKYTPDKSDFDPPRLNIIRDDLGMKGVKSMSDGKSYDSRAAYQRSLKEQGCHVVEAGEQKAKETPGKLRGDFGVKKELKQAIDTHLSTTKRKKRK